MVKKYKIKPYRSYYYYRRKKMVFLRIIISIILATGIILALMTFTRDSVETFIYKTQKAADEMVSIAQSLYLEDDSPKYSLYATKAPVKAVYLPAAYMNKLESLVTMANDTDVNAIVIDIKDDYGYLTFDTENPELQHMIKTKPAITNIAMVMDELYANEIYPIARIVTFKDKIMASKNPERMVKTKDGEIFKTPQGETWLDPYNKENWEYILEICKEAINVGFKEIQFDYVRFHESMKDSECNFPEEQTRIQVITEFIEYMYGNLHEMGVVVSADVFGTIITSKIDANIVGQDYKELIKHLDYICPMIYPSHYANGSFGIDYPDLEPYELVLSVMQYSNNIIKELPREERKAEVRPWLQDFTAAWIEPHQVYGAQEVSEQINATHDALINEWILWNAAGKYSQEGIPKEQTD